MTPQTNNVKLEFKLAIHIYKHIVPPETILAGLVRGESLWAIGVTHTVILFGLRVFITDIKTYRSIPNFCIIRSLYFYLKSLNALVLKSNK